MSKFIEEYFKTHQEFLFAANRMTCVQWDLATGVISSISGTDEFPEFFGSDVSICNIIGKSIYEFVRSQTYLKIRRKTNEYLNYRKNNNNGQFIIVSASNNTNHHSSENKCSIIQIYINRDENIGILTLYYADAFKTINDKIILVIELSGDFKGRVAFASSMNGEHDVNLINNEYEVLQLMSKGYTSEMIAKLLFSSKHTINDNRKNLLRKFKASNTFQLIYHAHQEGYI
jgi:DNA-binding CsgD family transcriptional regulator